MRPRKLWNRRTKTKAPCRKGGRKCQEPAPRPGGIAVFGSGATVTFGEETNDLLMGHTEGREGGGGA